MAPFNRGKLKMRQNKSAYIHHLIIEVNQSFPCSIVYVPVLPPEEGVDFIYKHISK